MTDIAPALDALEVLHTYSRRNANLRETQSHNAEMDHHMSVVRNTIVKLQAKTRKTNEDATDN